VINKGISKLGIFFLKLLSYLPLSVLYLFADGLYIVLYHIIGYRRAVVKENLLNSFPRKTAKERLIIEKKYYRYLASLMFEVIKMSSISKSVLKKHIVFKNTQLMQSYLDNEHSVLICSSHYGNWEWGTLVLKLYLNAVHYPIYKPLSNKVYDVWFHKVRCRFGNRLIPMRQTLRALKDSENETTIFSFGNDQAPAKNESHYWTTFLNQPSSIQLGIEKIAKRTNRPIFYLKVNVLKRGYYEVDCVPLCLEPQKTKEFEITELHTRFLEQFISEEPAYWLWSHKRWKHKPENT
jgi:KDO2-lipid IV(A) lauroyltransferase